MNEHLIQENKALREHLATVVANARYNEERMRRFHEQELRLLSSAGLVELLQQLLDGHRAAFDLLAVSLTLNDPEYEIRRLLMTLGHEQAFAQLRCLDSEEELTAFFGSTPQPRLGSFCPTRHGALFHLGEHPASVAIVPLVRKSALIGSLNLGSDKAERFMVNSATDFLERLGAVAAIGLENAINHERLKYIGLTDALTGVHNRRYFDRRLEEEVERIQRGEQPVSCLFLDVDRFKQVNDVHGHQVGDNVLKELVSRIKDQLRLSDVLGRYGGEEFVVLLVQTEAHQAYKIAERIRRSIAAQPFRISDDHALPITISIGVATCYPQAGESDTSAMAAALIAQADQAMYQAKQTGRNRVVQSQVIGNGLAETLGNERALSESEKRLPS